MSKQIFEPFINSISLIFKEMANIEATLVGALNTETEEIETMGVTSVISFTGKIKGRVMLDLEPSLALAVAENITGSIYDSIKDPMVMAAISEINNIISGKAIAPLNNELGLKLWMSPPYVFSGENAIICIPKLNSASLSYSTKYGNLKFNIAFEKGA